MLPTDFEIEPIARLLSLQLKKLPIDRGAKIGGIRLR